MDKILDQLASKFENVKGKTIAIVYIFEGDNKKGFEHFFIWKSNVISKWMNAVQSIHCLPLIMDVRTFVDKAINNTLPHIDYVLNLNSGTYNLSSMALIPSTCSAIGVPCIPCDAVGIIAGENKNLSNLIADSLGMNIPPSLSTPRANGIFRPISLGNSLGVKIGAHSNIKEGIYQEFIPGYDITTPIVYDAATMSMQLFPTVIFVPDDRDINWFINEDAKHARKGFRMEIIGLDDTIAEKYKHLVSALSVKSFCRIDARLKCTDMQNIEDLLITNIQPKDHYFIEINTMPTIQENNSFAFSLSSITSSYSFNKTIEAMKKTISPVDLHSFLLASSMISLV